MSYALTMSIAFNIYLLLVLHDARKINRELRNQKGAEFLHGLK